jgi:hypothetical protein
MARPRKSMDPDIKAGIKGVVAVWGLIAAFALGCWFSVWWTLVTFAAATAIGGITLIGFVSGMMWKEPPLSRGLGYWPPPWTPPDGGEPMPKPDNVVRLAASEGRRV